MNVLFLLLLAIMVLLIGMGSASAQAVPPASVNGQTNPADQPLPGQSLGTQLTLNQGINSLNAENESFDRFGFGLSALGGAETNFLGSQTNQITTGFAQFAAQGGIVLRTERTSYFALYQPQYTVYPSFTELNNFSQHAFQGLNHVISERSAIAWSSTAARYLSIDQYLPQTLGIGGVGIVVPTLGAQLLQDSFEITNVATSIQYEYLLSQRWTFTGAVTSGLFLMIPHGSGVNHSISEKFVTSGADLRLDYQLTRRSKVGVELTPIYIYGIQPNGHELAEAALGTYQRQLTPTLSIRAGAGPLFIQSSSPLFGSFRDTSYAVSAGLTRQVRQSQFGVFYNRAFLVNLLSPGVISNAFSGSARLPFGKHWIYTGLGDYVTDTSSAAAYGSGRVISQSSQLAYMIGTRVQIFGLYSVLSEQFSSGTSSQTYGFTRNQFGGGIRLTLGNPTTSGGIEATDSGGIE